LTIEQFFIENDFSRLTTISHFPLLFLRKMSHGSAIFQAKSKIGVGASTSTPYQGFTLNPLGAF
jgi:hypothetical protein